MRSSKGKISCVLCFVFRFTHKSRAAPPQTAKNSRDPSSAFNLEKATCDEHACEHAAMS